MSPQLSLITTCKGRLHHLQQTLPKMAAQPDAECIVVDYGCPQGTGTWVAENFPQVKVVRIGDDQGFNQCRARNFGAVAASASLFCFVDADIGLAPGFSSSIINSCTTKTLLRARPVTIETWGTFACRREDFWGVGGYDEVYQGWGASPEDLYMRLSAAGCSERPFSAELVSSIPHSDAERTTYYENKDRWWQHRINSLYLIAKLDVMKLLGTELPLEHKRRLYAESKGAIERAQSAQGNSASMEVSLADPVTSMMNLLIRLDRKLFYTIRWE